MQSNVQGMRMAMPVLLIMALFAVCTYNAQAQLVVYANSNYGGTSMTCGTYTYYKASQLGSLNDAISSFKLTKGYMATLAVDELGTGGSICYVAQDRDITVYQLPSLLDNKVSLVRVFPWRTTRKKGWAGGGTVPSTMNCNWNYDWDNVATSTSSIEYVPMRHNLNWNAYANINTKQGSTHVLSFNEPDSASQANLTVDAVWTQWHRFEESGLRICSPAPTDGGLSWLYEFFSELGSTRRCDVAAVHMYKGGWNGSTLNNWLNDIHNQTGRPVWVTEWNNGCNWTCCEPTLSSNATVIQDMCTYMNNNSSVERYAVYNWCGTNRELITSDGVINPAGTYYRNMTAPVAYVQATYANEGSGSSSSGGITGTNKRVINRASSKVLDAFGSTAGSNVGIYTDYSNANQRWTIAANGSGYTLREQRASLALDTWNWGTVNGTNIAVYTYWGGSPQTFLIQSVATGYYRITPSIATGQCVDAYGTSSGSNVGTWSYWGGSNQQWSIQ
ncbi:RICIN domain-containing protein [Candidatus Sumerlaeota bacterium]|nr:RICIN domain-containing protein [Candidatus Sumerlaeota bacterium]